MTVGIVGLGLIGGSLAKAYKKAGGITVFGYDIDTQTEQLALISGAIDRALTEKTLPDCDCIFLAILPDAAIGWLYANAGKYPPRWFGLLRHKRKICEAGFRLAAKYGFEFAGATRWPHKWGLPQPRRPVLGACFVIVPASMTTSRCLNV